ncbi:putative spermidine/putrescine transport system permease protein [Methylopila capsulata]|uniref:ABC transporter permease n=1 Tax=Methylopila capsulata TaxID=61654 RepID=A0A9W6IPZ5_9HYPH|nr:ABC transporter permease [Methylopila capsulata]MBM7851010.1 putative spermidine/putrescine transport system permease protein [Methylopila capsulata]GLK54068.1 ABC transporter permease [Methylopila capsulata]
MSRNGPLALVFHALVVVFALAPIVIVCVVAFTSHGYLSLPTEGPSLRWFYAIGDRPEFLRSVLDSLWLAAAASTLAVALAVPAALAIGRERFPGRGALLSLFQSPLMIPHLVLGIALLRFFTETGLGLSRWTLLAGHLVVVFPFALRLVLTASAGIDRTMENAAASLGASRWVVFRRVTLPLIMAGVVSGWILSFIQSFDEVTMSVFISTPETTTLPVRLFLYIQDNIDPLVASVSAALIFATVIAMVILDRLFGMERLLVGPGRG